MNWSRSTGEAIARSRSAEAGIRCHYRFRAIRTVPYPGRAPHIHVKVITGTRTLTTQFCLAGEPGNERDVLYWRLSAAERKAVEMRFETRDGVPTTAVILVA
ncbi:hypothetical protein [Anderseniella sp. Alg231-50]|uniref:hypothetical protein n=1 Tax=Anderseniella sp. Alg231-50 TaxID=1922226 RepID=UPI000D55B14B